jgi:hypothetical protein
MISLILKDAYEIIPVGHHASIGELGKFREAGQWLLWSRTSIRVRFI